MMSGIVSRTSLPSRPSLSHNAVVQFYRSALTSRTCRGPDAADPLLLGQRVVAILETGLRTATYKLATLMALIEHCIENLPAAPERRAAGADSRSGASRAGDLLAAGSPVRRPRAPPVHSPRARILIATDDVAARRRRSGRRYRAASALRGLSGGDRRDRLMLGAAAALPIAAPPRAQGERAVSV